MSEPSGPEPRRSTRVRTQVKTFTYTEPLALKNPPKKKVKIQKAEVDTSPSKNSVTGSEILEDVIEQNSQEEKLKEQEHKLKQDIDEFAKDINDDDDDDDNDDENGSGAEPKPKPKVLKGKKKPAKKKGKRYNPTIGSSGYAILWSLYDLFEKNFNTSETELERTFTPSEIFAHGNQYAKKPLNSTFYSSKGDSGIDAMVGRGLVLEDDDGRYTLTDAGVERCKELDELNKRPDNTKIISKKPRAYNPRYMSGSWAILKFLKDAHPETQSKDQICQGAQKYSNALFFTDNQNDRHDNYGWGGRPQFSAWDSVFTLSSKLLVIEYRGGQFGLSDEGVDKADNLKTK